MKFLKYFLIIPLFLNAELVIEITKGSDNPYRIALIPFQGESADSPWNGINAIRYGLSEPFVISITSSAFRKSGIIKKYFKNFILLD